MSSSVHRLAGGRGFRAWLGILSVTIPFSAVTAASAPKEYAYLRVQGTLSDRTQIHPLAGATIRLTSGSGVFEAVTDQRGTFVFEKLPITSYEIRIHKSDGEVVRDIRQVDMEVPQMNRFAIRFGKGEEQTALLEAREQSVKITAPEPQVRWGRFWTQFAVFLGCAGVLAL